MLDPLLQFFIFLFRVLFDSSCLKRDPFSPMYIRYPLRMVCLDGWEHLFKSAKRFSGGSDMIRL